MQNVCVFHPEHMETRKNVHVIITGKLRKEDPSALNNIDPSQYIYAYLFSVGNMSYQCVTA